MSSFPHCILAICSQEHLSLGGFNTIAESCKGSGVCVRLHVCVDTRDMKS